MLDSAAGKIYVKFFHRAGAHNLQQPDWFRLHRYYSIRTPILKACGVLGILFLKMRLNLVIKCLVFRRENN